MKGREASTRCAFVLAAALIVAGCSHSLVENGALAKDSLEAMLERTVITRYLDAPEDLDARLISQAEVRPILEATLRGERTEAELHAYQEGLVAIGLWPRDLELADAFLAVLAEATAGFYLPSEHALFIVSDLQIPVSLRLASSLAGRDLVREATLAHELVHMLQHASYPALLEPDPFLYLQDDIALAIQASVEGDATRYGFEAMGFGLDYQRLPLIHPDDFDAQLERERGRLLASGGAFGNSPALIRRSLLFPYQRGYRLSYSEGRKLVDDPPLSTEELLHPERRRHDFLSFDLSPLRKQLPASCEFISENTAGELYLSALFEERSSQPAPMVSASSDGWDGDRYLVARCAGDLEFLWITAWDSPTDAQEFEEAYQDVARVLAERAGRSKPATTLRSGQEVRIVTDALRNLAPELADGAQRLRSHDLNEIRAHYEPAPATPLP